MSFLDTQGHIWNLGTYNSDTELKLRTEIQNKMNLGFWVRTPTFSTQESEMSFIDPKLHMWTYMA